MDLSLKGKTALICGSSAGIGLASAVEISALGAECVLLARSESKLLWALSQLAPGAHHRYLVADFTQPDQVEAAVKSLLERGVVHVLVNNSGGPMGGPLLEAAPEAFLDAMRQHLICNQLLARAVIPGMRRDGYGRIINILSTSVKAPIKNLGVSNTTRWAVAAWAKTLAGEVAADGITVNNVLPGSTLTARLKNLFDSTAQQMHTSFQTVEESSVGEIPMRRFGKAEEIAALIAFLASPAAAYITGTSIPVDGGRTPGM